MALAGRRIDAEGAPERFPVGNQQRVAALIRDAMIRASAQALVSSAACGSDLLALEVAAELGIRRRVVLPFDPETFRSKSVVDRPGNWGSRFDRIISEVEQRGDLVLLGLPASEASAYERTNRAILSEGEALSVQVGAKDLVAVIVWEGKARGADDLTQQFLQEALARGLETVEVSTLAPAPHV